MADTSDSSDLEIKSENNNESDSDQIEAEIDDVPQSKPKKKQFKVKPEPLSNGKKCEPGIIYLSYIPQYMNVTKVRDIFNGFGTVGRLFLQPAKPNKKGKPSKQFTEGWVEFSDKRVAKRIASAMNGKQIGGKRKCPWYDSLWSIKYLHRFKWTHLNESLAYQKAVREQRMRNEISQAKKEANFYTHTSESTNRKRRKTVDSSVTTKDATTSGGVSEKNPGLWYSQKQTDEEIRRKKKRKNDDEPHNSFLTTVFGNK